MTAWLKDEDWKGSNVFVETKSKNQYMLVGDEDESLYLRPGSKQ